MRRIEKLRKRKILYPNRKVDIAGKELTDKDKRRIDYVIKKAIQEYGDVLRLLGRN